MYKTEVNGVVWANQFDNTVNTEAHIKTTAKEIWTQTAGQIHGFVRKFKVCYSKFLFTKPFSIVPSYSSRLK